jgi:hypothetical protein
MFYISESSSGAFASLITSTSSSPTITIFASMSKMTETTGIMETQTPTNSSPSLLNEDNGLSTKGGIALGTSLGLVITIICFLVYISKRVHEERLERREPVLLATAASSTGAQSSDSHGYASVPQHMEGGTPELCAELPGERRLPNAEDLDELVIERAR